MAVVGSRANQNQPSQPTADATLEPRARILRAAERLFAEKGYAATAVHEITDAAGVNRALLYYYFEDKHSLYAALIDDGNAEFQRMLDDALSLPGSHAERLAAVVRGHLDLIWRRGDMARVIHRCLLDGHEAEFGLLDKFNECVGRMERFFRQAAEAGEFRAVDPAIAARTFLGPSFILSLWPQAERNRFSREAFAEEITALLLRGLKIEA
jgi:AcrR family transcriptional regulator